jgi:hypothetical protein
MMSSEWELAGEVEVPGESLPQRPFLHHIFHITRPEIELGPLRWKADNKLLENYRGLEDNLMTRLWALRPEYRFKFLSWAVIFVPPPFSARLQGSSIRFCSMSSGFSFS